MDQQQIIADIEINIETSKKTIISLLMMYLEKIRKPVEAKSLVNTFIEIYEKALRLHEKEDQTDLARFYRLIIEFKPALAYILKPSKEFDITCDLVAQQFNVTLDRVRRQINEGHTSNKQLGTVLRKNQPIQLRYYCTICKQSFDISPDIQAQLLDSDEKIALPKHHDKELIVKIGDSEKETSPEKEPENKIKLEIYPAELLMQHTNSSESKAEYLKLLSVGIDVGSSTSHLVFSWLTLKREQSFFNITNRFVPIDRELIYLGNILFTPLIDPTTIDIEAVIKFFKEEYRKANLTPQIVDTGAVIVTGETAKKRNAEEIVKQLAAHSGKFVSASAGPNFESVLAARGSGIVDITRNKQNTIMNVDVGGGSSKLAIVTKGNIHSTSSINVGGRLLGIDKNFKIWRIDSPTKALMKELGMNYQLGDIIMERDVRAIAHEYANALIEVMHQPATSSIAKKLMLTADLDFSVPINEISFSGGVAEMIYEIYTSSQQGQKRADDKSSRPFYDDIGWYLSEEIIQLLKKINLPVIEPEYKIRATVIGAGFFSLSVSGSTCYYDPKIQLPLENIPIVSIDINFREMMSSNEVKIRKFKEKIALALDNVNLVEGVDPFALFFNDITIRGNLEVFAKTLERALPRSFSKNKLVIIILGFDGAKMLGLTIKKETTLHENIFCLDELYLDDGDWIDIGQPLGESHAFPITIKTLVFNQNKQTEDISANIRKEQTLSTTRIQEKSTIQTLPKLTLQTSSESNDSIPLSPLKPESITQAFKKFQAAHKGYDILIILSQTGDLEFTTDTRFLTSEDAKKIFKAWKNHEPAFFIGEKRYPIVSWAEQQFAAQNTKNKEIIVGTKTKTNRYVVMKVDPEGPSKMQPNIAAVAVVVLNQWSWDLL